MLLELMSLLFRTRKLIKALGEASLKLLQDQYHCSDILQLVAETPRPLDPGAGSP
jgi:hypothetical protein